MAQEARTENADGTSTATRISALDVFFTLESSFSQVGLDAAGKTTVLYKLKLGEIVTTIPTIGKSLRSH